MEDYKGKYEQLDNERVQLEGELHAFCEWLEQEYTTTQDLLDEAMLSNQEITWYEGKRDGLVRAINELNERSLWTWKEH